MAVEDVQSNLQLVREGAERFGIDVSNMADEDSYQTLPDRALRIAELAAEMAALIDGIDADVADFNLRASTQSRTTRERLGGIAAKALDGSTDPATPYILQSVRLLGTGEFDPRASYTEAPLASAEARSIGRRALKMAQTFRANRLDIDNVTQTRVDNIVGAIDRYGKKL